MKRRELREHIFQLLFRVEFNEQDEMAEQVSLYVDDMKEEEIVEPKDETYIEEKYKKIVERFVLQMRSLPLSQVWRPLMYVELHPWRAILRMNWFP